MVQAPQSGAFSVTIITTANNFNHIEKKTKTI